MAVYGPLINAIQDMWDDHAGIAAIKGYTGGCDCDCCVRSQELFEALMKHRESWR